MATWQAMTSPQTPGPCRARITRVCDGGETVQLGPILARIAVAGSWQPQVGEEVLVIEGDEYYVIGVLRTAEPSPVRVRDRRGELLFEYDSAKDEAKLRVGASSLVIESEKGDITFRSAGEIRMDCEALRVVGSDSSLEVGPAGLRYRGSSFQVEAKNGAVHVDDLSVDGRTLEIRHGRVQLIARTVRTIFDTLVERARNVYRHVEETHQLRAQRVRVCVDDLYQVHADKASITAKRDVKINADKIHLG